VLAASSEESPGISDQLCFNSGPVGVEVCDSSASRVETISNDSERSVDLVGSHPASAAALDASGAMLAFSVAADDASPRLSLAAPLVS
jgi:hypothetical protein